MAITLRMSFTDWMKKVDELLMARCGMCHRDLPDWRYRDAYDEGMTAREAARRAYHAAKDA